MINYDKIYLQMSLVWPLIIQKTLMMKIKPRAEVCKVTRDGTATANDAIIKRINSITTKWKDQKYQFQNNAKNPTKNCNGWKL